ncbi:hypothetical protein CCR82_05155 [Halochromatium salexigens]|uniref:Uncharacterized protein n=1 Tax=Halochromatium salexigens TaxID=49447 RepID=A0AAJ0UFG9_HALSE|nr:hypothetical protein [Halochromatium salexigens]
MLGVALGWVCVGYRDLLLRRILAVLQIGARVLAGGPLDLAHIILRESKIWQTTDLAGALLAAIPLATRKLLLARLILGPFVSRHPVISGLR